jgi:hypothetical protein
MDDVCNELAAIGVVEIYPSFMDRAPTNSLEARTHEIIEKHGLQCVNNKLKEIKKANEWGRVELIHLFGVKLIKK